MCSLAYVLWRALLSRSRAAAASRAGAPCAVPKHMEYVSSLLLPRCPCVNEVGRTLALFFSFLFYFCCRRVTPSSCSPAPLALCFSACLRRVACCITTSRCWVRVAARGHALMPLPQLMSCCPCLRTTFFSHSLGVSHSLHPFSLLAPTPGHRRRASCCPSPAPSKRTRARPPVPR